MVFLAIDNLSQVADKFRGTLLKRSDFLGPHVHQDVCTQVLYLCDVVNNENELKYILNKDGPGFKFFSRILLPENSVDFTDEAVVFKFPARDYR